MKKLLCLIFGHVLESTPQGTQICILCRREWRIDLLGNFERWDK